MEDKKIMYESDEAAKPVTVKAWKNDKGVFLYEDLARYAGSTHRLCPECRKEEIYRSQGTCNACGLAKEAKTYKAFPLVKWDGTFPLSAYDSDKYFFDAEELLEYLHDSKGDGAMLVTCHPDYGPRFGRDNFQDHVSDADDYFDDEIQAAMDRLNEIIEKKGPFSWWQNRERVDAEEVYATLSKGPQ